MERPPARLATSLSTGAAFAFALAALACSFPDPPKSLRTLMLQQEIAVIALERDATTAPAEELVKHAERVIEVSTDPAFAGHESRPIVRGRVAEWRALHERYVEESEAVLTAARSADRESLVAALTRLRATCDGCHVQFRPGL